MSNRQGRTTLNGGKIPLSTKKEKIRTLFKEIEVCQKCSDLSVRLNTVWEINRKIFPVVECGEVHWFEIFNEPKTNDPLDVMLILIMPREPIWTKNGKLAPSRTDKMLANHYISELKNQHLSFYLTDLLKCGDVKKDISELGAEVGQCWHFLQQEIEILQPRKIVTFGKYPQHDISLLLSLFNTPQVVMDKVRPLNHPSRGKIEKAKFQEIIAKLIKKNLKNSLKSSIDSLG